MKKAGKHGAIELVSLAPHKAQRNIGVSRRARALPPPGDRVTPNSRIAARVSQGAQVLKNPDQRQTFTRRSAVVLIKQCLELLPPWADSRQRLLRTLVMKLGRVRSDDFANHLARNAQFPADLFDRLP
jgi:hypothetical protein